MKFWYLPLLLAVNLGCAASLPSTVPAPASAPADHFDSTGSDRSAIDRLLATYTLAVSTKNQALFETLLLAKTIPFTYIGAAPLLENAGVTNYEAFRHGVFDGAPFTQQFSDIHIQQDGNVASVTLVFVNTTAKDQSWGWKTMQLIKTAGGWKIASEFFTAH